MRAACDAVVPHIPIAADDLRAPRGRGAAPRRAGVGEAGGLGSAAPDESNGAPPKLEGPPDRRRHRPGQPVQSVDVLVVDDDEDYRVAIESSLQLLGYPVRVAHSGAEALAEYERKPAAIVLTDWSMPGMSGIDLCVALKHKDPPPHVLMMTAFDERARLIDALRAGADEFIGKPLAFEELEVRLLAASRIVNTQRALRGRNEALRHESVRDFRLARTDSLTAVPNRLSMEEDLARAISDAARAGRHYCLALCDIDHFKRYNDRNGHLAGDAALQRVAAALRDGVRSGDTVYRFGGEEFVILFPDQSPEEVALALDRIRASVKELGIENPPLFEAGVSESGVSGSGVLTISAGVAAMNGRSKAEWLAEADAALYRAKGEGRDRVAIG